MTFINEVKNLGDDDTTLAAVVQNVDDDTNLDGENGIVVNGILYGRIDSSIIKPLRIDASTHTMQTIAYPHHEIHAGDHYYMEGKTELDSGVSLYVKLVTPDTTKWAHFLWEISSSAILETMLYEGVSGGMTGGAAVTPINNNRNSVNTSGLVITSGVTVATDLGLTISQLKWGARSFGGGSSREDEIILKQNTTYLRAFTSGTNGNLVNFKASWYEHTDKD